MFQMNVSPWLWIGVVLKGEYAYRQKEGRKKSHSRRGAELIHVSCPHKNKGDGNIAKYSLSLTKGTDIEYTIQWYRYKLIIDVNRRRAWHGGFCSVRGACSAQERCDRRYTCTVYEYIFYMLTVPYIYEFVEVVATALVRDYTSTSPIIWATHPQSKKLNSP